MKRIQRTRHLTEAEAAALRETRRQVEAEFPPADALTCCRKALKSMRDAAMNTPALDSSRDWTALIEAADAALAVRAPGTLVKSLADTLQFLAAVIETAEAEDPDDASTHALVVNHGLAVLHNGVEALRAAGVEFEPLKDEPPFIPGQRVRIRAPYRNEDEAGELYEVVKLEGDNRVDIRWLGWDLAKHGVFPPVETVGREMIEPVSN